MLDVVSFWLRMGLDGFRVDAVPYLFEREGTNCENLPETHAFLKKLRAYVDEHHPNCLLLAEANQWPEDVVEYFGEGDEFHMGYHFPIMPRLFMALRQEDRRPIVEILERTPDIPATCQWGMFLRNHDELTLEMVTGDNIYLGDRDGVRTPMQWSSDRNAGFSRADFEKLYFPVISNPVYGFQTVNVETQARYDT